MKKILILIISLSLLALSCKIQEPNIKQPKDFSIDNINYKDKIIKISLILPIENPNNISFNLKNANINLLLNKKKVGKIQKLQKTKILANSKLEYQIKFEISLKDMETSLFSLISDLQFETPQIDIKGDITFSKFLLRYKVKIDESKSF